MKFKTKRTKLQNIAVIGIILSVLISFILPENKYFLFYLRLYGVSAITIFVLLYSLETRRKHVILNPYKKNNYRSKPEIEIADYLKRKKIIFVHEKEIVIDKTFGPFLLPFPQIKLHPDFYLPEFEIFVEYWGLMHKKDYKEKHDLKQLAYKKNKVDLIDLYPEDLKNLDEAFTSKFLDIIKEKSGVTKIYE